MRPKLNVIRVYKSDDGLTFEDKAAYLQHQQSLVLYPKLVSFFSLAGGFATGAVLDTLVTHVAVNAEVLRQILGAPKRVLPASQTGLVNATPPAAPSFVEPTAAVFTPVAVIEQTTDDEVEPLNNDLVTGAVLMDDD